MAARGWLRGFPMRTLTLGLAALLLLAVPAVADARAAPAPAALDQAAICVVGDVYNTGSLPCAGLVCYGQTQYAWQNCVGSRPCLPPRCHIPPPGSASADGQVAICVAGDAYNTGGGPCEGAVCLGWTMGHWVDCYPRFPPCLACPPPPPAIRFG